MQISAMTGATDAVAALAVALLLLAACGDRPNGTPASTVQPAQSGNGGAPAPYPPPSGGPIRLTL
jgi:hypothetical protein